MGEKRMPPFSALRAFELAARLGTLTRAAERLDLTQSAVTRQVAALEASLGKRLLERGRRGVELTPAGREYLEEIAPAFAMISDATERLRRQTGSEVLRLRVYPVFAVKWLIPRLADFAAYAPRVQVELETSVDPANFERVTLDAAIQVSTGDESDVRSEMLIPDEIEPICSPAFLARQGGEISLQDLARLPLYHAHYRRADWTDWALANDLPEVAQTPGVVWPSSLLVYQAAQDGLGLAMGQNRLLEREFEAGSLMRPFRRPLRRRQAYYLMTPLSRPPPLRVRHFMAWLRRMIGTAG